MMAFAARFGQPKQKHVVATREDSASVLADRPGTKVSHEAAAQVLKLLLLISVPAVQKQR